MRWIVSLAMCLVGVFLAPANAFEIKMLPPLLEARVDLTTQRVNIVVEGEVQHTWKISSGLGRRYATPNGEFTPYRMHTLWRSRKYGWAPMPYAVFYDGGYALHGTNAVWRLGRPASHGCIRLTTANAKTFFNLVKKYKRARTRVIISGEWKLPKRKARVYKKKRRKIVRTKRYGKRYKQRSVRTRVWRGKKVTRQRQALRLRRNFNVD